MQITLPVIVQPENESLKVPLQPDCTVEDLVFFCQKTANLTGEYYLVGDFGGFEKQFSSSERIYNLVRKQVFVSNGVPSRESFSRRRSGLFSFAEKFTSKESSSDAVSKSGNVVFYMRKRKSLAVSSLTSIVQENNSIGVDKVDPLSLEMGAAFDIEESNLSTDDDNDLTPVEDVINRFADDLASISETNLLGLLDSIVTPEMDAAVSKMSHAELSHLAGQQKMKIGKNKEHIDQKEMKLRSLKQQEASVTHRVLTGRLKVLRERVQTEEKQLSRLRQLRGDVSQQRALMTDAEHDLSNTKKIYSDKERELEHAIMKVGELTSQLDALRKQNAENIAFSTNASQHERQQILLLKQQLQARASMRNSSQNRLQSQQTTLSNRRSDLGDVDAKVDELSTKLQTWRQEQQKQLPNAPEPPQQFMGIRERNQGSNRSAERPRAAVEPFLIGNQLAAGHAFGLSPSDSPSPETNRAASNQKSTEPQFEVDMTVTSGQFPPTGGSFLASRGFATAFEAVQEVLEKQAPEINPAADDSQSGRKSPYSKFLQTSASHLAPRPFQRQTQTSAPTPFSNNVTSVDGSAGSRASPLQQSTETPDRAKNYNMQPRGQLKSAPQNFIASLYTSQNRGGASPPKQNVNQGADRSSLTSTDSNNSTSVNSGSDSPGSYGVSRSTDSRRASKPKITVSRRFGIPDMDQLGSDVPPPDLIPRREWVERRGSQQNHPPAPPIPQPQPEENTDEFYSHVESDVLHLRADNLRAAKRRSWAEHSNTGAPGAAVTDSEADHIRRFLKREQQFKGSTNVHMSRIIHELQTSPKLETDTVIKRPDSLKFDFNSNNSPKAQVQPDVERPRDLDEKLEAKSNVPTPQTPEKTTIQSSPDKTPPLSAMSPITLNDKVNVPSTPDIDTDPPIRPPPSYDELILRNMTSVPKKERNEPGHTVLEGAMAPVPKIEVVSTEPPRKVKGILRPQNAPKQTRRIFFDPLAILLDAALEGELELVKESARKLTSVSISNDEGITALHNAICAGHYEIVRFLVEAEADVNAPDSDGWTPLHCAASCNNLPMVKFLVENGACIFATTVSDHETPADKCEEEEDGYDGCSQFLIMIQEKLGIMNAALTFAAFSYDAQQEDELTFCEGDELVVLKHDDGPPVNSAEAVRSGNSCSEKGWWWCKKTDGSATKEGYAPRNYLGLYPRLRHQRRSDMVARCQQLTIDEHVAKRNSNSSTTSNNNDNDLPVEGIEMSTQSDSSPSHSPTRLLNSSDNVLFDSLLHRTDYGNKSDVVVGNNNSMSAVIST